MFEFIAQEINPIALFLPFIPWVIIVLMIIAFGAFIFLMGPEGRFFLGRAITNTGGIDMLEANPLTGQIELSVIRWSGQYWVRGRGKESEGIWFGFKNLLTAGEGDADGASINQLNEAMNSKSTWKGCHRSVLLNTQNLNLVYTPHLGALFTRAAHEIGVKDKGDIKTISKDLQSIFNGGFEKAEESLKDKPEVLNIYRHLRQFYGAGLRGVHINEPIDTSVIQKLWKGNTAKQVSDIRDEGITIGQLKMTRPKGSKPFHFPWLIVGLLLVTVVVIGVVLYLIQSGALNNIIPTG